MVSQYIALFEYEEGKKGFGVSFPDLPGVVTAGNDYEEAVRMAHEALALAAEGEKNFPKPRALERLKKEWPEWKEWERNYNFYIVPIALYPMKHEVKRFNVSLDAGLVARIDRVAANRSAFIEVAARKYLDIGGSE
ncbi:MAG: type II toxin-antitoxin system HicB family antitoxin [Treponema sp.]|nr:type II toxin-antitoxin system HicB family antitoxin [Treponema sp.]